MLCQSGAVQVFADGLVRGRLAGENEVAAGLLDGGGDRLTGGAADRLVQLSFLDVRHEALRRRGGNQHLHRASSEYRDAVRRKLHAYHVFIQAAVVCQGLLQYLAVAFPQRVWDAFGSWLDTIRLGIPPSELVVVNALRQSMPEFRLDSASGNRFAKFNIGRQYTDKMPSFRLAS